MEQFRGGLRNRLCGSRRAAGPGSAKGASGAGPRGLEAVVRGHRVPAVAHGAQGVRPRPARGSGGGGSGAGRWIN